VQLVKKRLDSSKELRILIIRLHSKALLQEVDEYFLLAAAQVYVLVQIIKVFFHDFIDLIEHFKETGSVFFARLLHLGPLVAVLNELDPVFLPEANEVLGTAFWRNREINDDTVIWIDPGRKLEMFRLSRATDSNNSSQAFFTIHFIF